MIWTITNKRKLKKNQVSATYAHLMNWMEEGCFPKRKKKVLQCCKSNQKFYRGENRK